MPVGNTANGQCLCLVGLLLFASGCVSLSPNRYGESATHPDKAVEQTRTVPYPKDRDLQTPVPPPEAAPDVPVEQLPIVPLDENRAWRRPAGEGEAWVLACRAADFGADTGAG